MNNRTWKDSEDGKFVILYDGDKIYKVDADRVHRILPQGQPNYRIGNDQILEKMRGLYGNPKGCQTGKAPKPSN